MIVHIVDIKCLALRVPEDNAPVRPDCHSPKSFQFAFERMEAEAGQVQICDRGRGIKARKNIAQSFSVFASNARRSSSS
jgi:hypothetical protein